MAEEDGWREERWHQLGNAISMRSSQDQVLWGIFGVFAAANAVLFVALFTTGRFPQDPIVGLVIAFVGLLMTTTWLVIQARALGHVRRHEVLIKRIDASLLERYHPDFSINYSKDYRGNLPGSIPSARVVMPIGVVIFIALWTVLFVVFSWASASPIEGDASAAFFGTWVFAVLILPWALSGLVLVDTAKHLGSGREPEATSEGVKPRGS